MDFKKLWHQVRKKPNVCGYESQLMPRIKAGKVVKGTECFRVYVERKITVKRDPVGYRRLVMKKGLIPVSLEDNENIVITDVVAIGKVTAPPPTKWSRIKGVSYYDSTEEQDPRKRYRPILAGVSAMHHEGSACTLGWFARREGMNTCIVSNNHCCAESNKASMGDPYLQPSPYDGGKYLEPSRPSGFSDVGRLVDFVPLRFNEYECAFRNFFHKIAKRIGVVSERPNHVDAGLVETYPEEKPKLEVLSIGTVKGKRPAELGEKCHKNGRTTSYTKDGAVTGTDWCGWVQYGRGRVWFEDCILVQGEGFSAGGDSSSAILGMKDDHLLGLLFAGSTSYTVVCKQANIEDELEVQFIVG